MAFGKFVRDLLHIKLEEESSDNERQAEVDPATGEEKPEPARTYLWVLLILVILSNILVFVYFGFATAHYLDRENGVCLNPSATEKAKQLCGFQLCNGYGCLMLIFVLVYIGLIYFLIFKPLIGRRLHRSYLAPADDWWMNISRTWIVTIILLVIAMALVVTIIVLESLENPRKLTGIVGPIVFIAAGWLFSTKRSIIKWRIVVTGIFWQFALGVICLRLPVGRDVFKCFGSKVAKFLGFTAEGSRFVFGSQLVDNWVFAFAVLSVIFFFSFFVSILYYLGVMQWVVLKLGWILQQTVGTTVCESVVAAANIFLGMSESPLLIRPYLKFLTASEIHAIMVSGFATVSGTVLAAYISFGASPAHLITASVMAAPGALAFAKLYMPEEEESQTSSDTIILQKSEDESLLGAAASGAGIAIPIVLGITANIVAFLAFIAFLNAIIAWLFLLIDVDGVTFVWIFSRIFIPLAWSMGIPWEDCDVVAKILAVKTIINEFVAYERLGYYTKIQEISARSSGITTFAICGFANPGSMGILIGSLSAMSPTSKSSIVKVAFRAFVVGSIVCFASASFAGILMNEEMEKAMYDRIFANLDSKNPAANQTAGNNATDAQPPSEESYFRNNLF